MKRRVIKGILTASLVAACLLARGATSIYSQNVGSFLNVPIISEASTIWQIGPFAVGESHYWIDASGNMLTRVHEAGDPVRSSTWFVFGETSISVPLSPSRLEIVGATVLFGLGAILTGMLAKKCVKSAVTTL